MKMETGKMLPIWYPKAERRLTSNESQNFVPRLCFKLKHCKAFLISV